MTTKTTKVIDNVGYNQVNYDVELSEIEENISNNQISATTSITSCSTLNITPEYAIHCLKKILVIASSFGQPGSSGSFKSNFLEIMREEHPLLSIVTGNKVSSFSKNNRIILLVSQICFTWYFTGALLANCNFYIDKCDTAGIEATNRNLLISFIVGATQSIWSISLRGSMECACIHKKNYVKKRKINKCFEFSAFTAGYIFTSVCSGISILLYFLGHTHSKTLNENYGIDYIGNTFQSLLIGWCFYNICFQALYYYIRYDNKFYSCKNDFQQHFNPYFPELIDKGGFISITQLGIKAKVKLLLLF
jgi:hypothetical protein